MRRSHFVAGMITIELAVSGVGVVSSQDFPNKPIRILTTEAGSNADFNARVTAEGLSSALRQPVIVENRAGNVIAPETVARAAADGYTLLVVGGSFWVGPLLRKTSYDPVKDFSPISMLVRSPNILVVHPSLPVKSVKELIALAKAKPGELNYASTGLGGSFHLAAELFKSMAGVNIVHIPYKGTAIGLNDLIAGQVQLSFTNPGAAMPFVRAGRLRALAVTSAEPSALFPELPTIAASGLPGYEASTIQGIWAPARTPGVIVDRLNQEITRFFNRAETKERFLNVGVEAAPSSSDQFAGWIKSEMTRIGKVIKDIGLRVD